MDMAKKVSFTRFAQFTSEQADVPAPVYELTGPDDDTLLFESRFESGNLLSACRIGPNEYNLTLRRLSPLTIRMVLTTVYVGICEPQGTHNGFTFE